MRLASLPSRSRWVSLSGTYWQTTASSDHTRPGWIRNSMTFERTRLQAVKIRERYVGPAHPCFVVAEIGINHNGSLGIAKALIDAAVAAGCDAVKFQKRTVDVVYSAEEVARPRENPFGPTNGDLKRGLEFSADQYAEI